MPFWQSIVDPSTNPPKPMFQLSGDHCNPLTLSTKTAVGHEALRGSDALATVVVPKANHLGWKDGDCTAVLRSLVTIVPILKGLKDFASILQRFYVASWKYYQGSQHGYHCTSIIKVCKKYVRFCVRFAGPDNYKPRQSLKGFTGFCNGFAGS